MPIPPAFWTQIEENCVPLVKWIPVNEAIAVTAADIRAEMKKRGKTGGIPDCLIAATAVVHDWGLVTRNVADFSGVPGLHLENWFR